MEIICHRVNTINNLIQIPKEYGVEIDIRSYKDKLILHHDPFVEGEEFDLWLKNFHHETLILNIKEEGLEDKILFFLEKFGIKKYFFLDQSFPFLIRNVRKGIPNSALRISNYESIETLMNLSGKVNWVWVDIFNSFPISVAEYNIIKKLNYKLCYVSPELQGFNKSEILELKKFIYQNNIIPDAVCTKFPKIWQE